MTDTATKPITGLCHIAFKAAVAAALAGQLMLSDVACAAEDMLTQSAKWMKISGYIIGTAVACGISESEATPVGSKVIDNTALANGNTISKTALAEIHVKTFLGAIKMQKKIGNKGCDVAISKFERLKASP